MSGKTALKDEALAQIVGGTFYPTRSENDDRAEAANDVHLMDCFNLSAEAVKNRF